jgi:DNA-binding NarL/FixJ family response regulator
MAAGRPHSSVVAVDDDQNLLDVIAQHLEALNDQFDLVTFTSPTEALDYFTHRVVNLALLDLRLPEIDGYKCARAIRTKWPETAVLLITGIPDLASAYAALECGARGILFKPFSGSELRAAVTAALNGLFTCSLGTVILPKDHRLPVDWAALLSTRQREVAIRLLRGCSDKEIARELGIAPTTAHAHVQAIFRALRVTSRAELLRLAHPSAPAPSKSRF